MANKSVNFTEGDVVKKVIIFAWPLFLSNVFQQIYNITNSMIAGNYISTAALSAISACGPIINIFNYFFYGISTGVSIVIAQLFGSGDREKLNKAVQSVFFVSLIIGLSLTIISESCLDWLLNISNVQADIYQDTYIYLKIYLYGTLSVMTYNMFFGVLRSIGDSKNPLIYLITSTVLNVLLGVFFVKVFNWTISGIALATIISQTIVDILCVRLMFNTDAFDLSFKKIECDWQTIRRVFSLGIPAAIQNMLIGVSSMMVQSYINLFPMEAISGIGVAQKLNSWVAMPALSITSVTSNYVGQNYGAGNYDKIRKGVKWFTISSLVLTTLIVAPLCWKAEFFVGLFRNEPEIIRYGSQMVRYCSIGYLFLCFSHIYNGVCRSAGNMYIPLMIAVCSQCLFRYLFVYFMMPIWQDIRVIYLSESLCYVLAGVLAFVYFNFGKWTKENNLR